MEYAPKEIEAPRLRNQKEETLCYEVDRSLLAEETPSQEDDAKQQQASIEDSTTPISDSEYLIHE